MQCEEEPSPTTSTRDTVDSNREIDLSGESNSVEQHQSTISNTDDANIITDDLSGQNNFEVEEQLSSNSNKDDENMANDGNFDLQKDLERQMGTILNEMTLYKQIIQENKAQIVKDKNENEALIRDMEDLKKTNRDLQAKVQEILDKNTILKNRLYDYKEVEEEINDSKEKFAEELKVKESELRAKNREIKDLKLDLKNESQMLENKCNQNDRLTEEGDVMAKEHSQLKTTARHLKNEKSQKENEVKHLTEKNKQQSKEIQALDKKIGELQTKEKKTCSSLKEVTKKKKKYMQTTKKLNSEIKKAIDLMQTANNKVQQYQKEVKHLKEENEEQQRRFIEAKSDLQYYYFKLLFSITILFIIFGPYFIPLITQLCAFILYLFTFY